MMRHSHFVRSIVLGGFMAGGFLSTSMVEAGSPTPLPNRRPSVDPILVGEKQLYDITYLGVPAVKFEMQVMEPEEIRGRKAYRVRATAQSLKIFSLIYRVDDWVETRFDHEALVSHRFHLYQDESKQLRDSLEDNDQGKGQTSYWNRWTPKGRPLEETRRTETIPPLAQDYLSALYFIRTQPLPADGVITFPVVSEGNSFETVVTVARRETMQTAIGAVSAVVLRVEKRGGDGRVEPSQNYIWISDDSRRVLLQVEAKVKIGSIKAVLRAFEPGREAVVASGSGEPARGRRP